MVQGKIFANNWLAAIGAASFSIFVWHQVVLAMIKYSFTNNLTEATPLLAFVAITVVLSVISYKYVEKMKKTKVAWGFIALLFVLTTAGSLFIYANAGVVRDVPELKVVKGKVHRECGKSIVIGAISTIKSLLKIALNGMSSVIALEIWRVLSWRAIMQIK